MFMELTRLSSRGQIVIPRATRKRLGLRAGAKFAIFTDGHNVLLQPLAQPDVAGFRRLVAEAAKSSARRQVLAASQ